ncbi:MAG: hypothetical protein CR982_06115 [Candidatus Cloacimonadota bacterium]|nr:MAG: hypothetical protein CR982_06115 [Candidatus Cloacimonadota bacterium]PIE78095.1 MAG: hypothetical protein CSA15_09675 [Candidatus Delongbacteria bacterium]
MRYLIEYLRLVRFINILIISLSLVVTAILIELPFNITTFLTILTVVLTLGNGNIINDIFDYDIDLVNRAKRVLPSGRISLRSAKIIYSITLFIIIFIGSLLSERRVIELLLVNGILFLYSSHLKKIPILSNITVSLITAYTFLYISNFKLDGVVIFFMLTAFFTNFSREIVKDFEDIEGDILFGYKSLPFLNKKLSKSLVKILLFLNLGITILYFRNSIIEASLLIMLNIYLVAIDPFKEAGKYQKWLKLLMGLGILTTLFVERLI